MLARWLMTVMLLLHEAWSARRDVKIRFLKPQIELLRTRLPGNRVILDPVERRRLMRMGAQVDHQVQDILGIVSFKTYRRWQREERLGRESGKIGRRRVISGSLRELIIRLARENTCWGVRRIVGELKKLALMPSRSSVRRVLVDERLLPDPDRRPRNPEGVMTPWRTFVAMHLNTMVACDFFCKRVWTLRGRRLAFCLAFIHLGSRKVFVSPGTFHPGESWMQQQARNVSMWAEDEGLDIRYLIHDHDTKFTQAFDRYFHREGGRVVLTPFQAPVANCYAESWIGHLKREALNHFFCFSLGHLDHIVQSYTDYYNRFRPHRSLGNLPLGEAGKPPPECRGGEEIGIVHRHSHLAGLLNHYERKAA